MQIITPGMDQLVKQRLEENPYAMTNFGFQRTVANNELEKEFVGHLTSGLLWEDGTRFAMGLIADRNGKMFDNKDIIGGIIDPADEFWQQESDNGMTLINNMIWHHAYHRHAVIFGRKDEWEDDSKRGAGYFRLAIDSSQAQGDRRWAMVEFEMTGISFEKEHRHVKESIDRMKDHGWDVWRIDETYFGGYGAQNRRRMVFFVLAPEPLEHKRFTHRMEKAIMKRLGERLIVGNNRSSCQPSRREEGNMMPLPCLELSMFRVVIKISKF